MVVPAGFRGIWKFKARATIGVNEDKRLELIIRRNGFDLAIFSETRNDTTASGDRQSICANESFLLEEGDVIEIFFLQFSSGGGDVPLISTSAANNIEATFLGGLPSA